jgi:hypothetical protein
VVGQVEAAARHPKRPATILPDLHSKFCPCRSVSFQERQDSDTQPRSRTTMEPKVEQVIEPCCICYEPNTMPYVIKSCMHSLCKACVFQLLSKSSSAKCPKCRKYFYRSDAVPNYDMIALIEKLGVQTQASPEPAKTVPQPKPKQVQVPQCTTPLGSAAVGAGGLPGLGSPGGSGSFGIALGNARAVLPSPGRGSDLVRTPSGHLQVAEWLNDRSYGPQWLKKARTQSAGAVAAGGSHPTKQSWTPTAPTTRPPASAVLVRKKLSSAFDSSAPVATDDATSPIVGRQLARGDQNFEELERRNIEVAMRNSMASLDRDDAVRQMAGVSDSGARPSTWMPSSSSSSSKSSPPTPSQR